MRPFKPATSAAEAAGEAAGAGCAAVASAGGVTGGWSAVGAAGCDVTTGDAALLPVSITTSRFFTGRPEFAMANPAPPCPPLRLVGTVTEYWLVLSLEMLNALCRVNVSWSELVTWMSWLPTPTSAGENSMSIRSAETNCWQRIFDAVGE